MKTKAVSAQAADLSTEQRAALQADFDSLRSQVDQIANSATFNGLNLVAAGLRTGADGGDRAAQPRALSADHGGHA